MLQRKKKKRLLDLLLELQLVYRHGSQILEENLRCSLEILYCMLLELSMEDLLKQMLVHLLHLLLVLGISKETGKKG